MVEYVVDRLGGDTTVSQVTEVDLQELAHERVHLVAGEPVSAGTKERMLGVRTAWFCDAVRFDRHYTNIAADLPSSCGLPARAGEP